MTKNISLKKKKVSNNFFFNTEKSKRLRGNRQKCHLINFHLRKHLSLLYATCKITVSVPYTHLDSTDFLCRFLHFYFCPLFYFHLANDTTTLAKTTNHPIYLLTDTLKKKRKGKKKLIDLFTDTIFILYITPWIFLAPKLSHYYDYYNNSPPSTAAITTLFEINHKIPYLTSLAFPIA